MRMFNDIVSNVESMTKNTGCKIKLDSTDSNLIKGSRINMENVQYANCFNAQTHHSPPDGKGESQAGESQGRHCAEDWDPSRITDGSCAFENSGTTGTSNDLNGTNIMSNNLNIKNKNTGLDFDHDNQSKITEQLQNAYDDNDEIELKLGDILSNSHTNYNDEGYTQSFIKGDSAVLQTTFKGVEISDTSEIIEDVNTLQSTVLFTEYTGKGTIAPGEKPDDYKNSKKDLIEYFNNSNNEAELNKAIQYIQNTYKEFTATVDENDKAEIFVNFLESNQSYLYDLYNRELTITNLSTKGKMGEFINEINNLRVKTLRRRVKIIDIDRKHSLAGGDTSDVKQDDNGNVQGKGNNLENVKYTLAGELSFKENTTTNLTKNFNVPGFKVIIQNGATIKQSGGTLNVTGNSTITIKKGATLTINSNGELNDSTIELYGNLTGSGTIEVKNGGIINKYDGSTIDSNLTINEST